MPLRNRVNRLLGRAPIHDVSNGSKAPLNLKGLWGDAYKQLQKEDATLLEAFEKDLSHQQNPGQSVDGQSEVALHDLVEQRLRDIENSKLKFVVAGREIVVKDQVRRVVQTLLSVKDIITTAVSAEPHAAVAWAGILVLFSPVANSIMEDEDAIQGFESISNILVRYRVMESTHIELRPKKGAVASTGPVTELGTSVRDKTVKLYAGVLKYQIRLAKQYSRSGFFRFLKDLVVPGNWKDMLVMITEIDRRVKDDLRILNDHTLRKIETTVTNLANEMNTALGLLREVRDEAKASKQLQLLESLPCAVGAAFNSFEDQHQPRCLNGTQVTTLTRIQDWGKDANGQPIFWLKGMAGTGKSTISRTVAAAYHDRTSLVDDIPLTDNGYFGGSFFFNQSKPDRNNSKKLFTTFARSLAQVLPDLKELISEAVANNPNIGSETLNDQWKYLIFQPLSALERHILSPVILILVIDALDECEPESDVALIFSLLSQVKHLQKLQIRVFIASRPDTHIRVGFSRTLESSVHVEILNKIPVPAAENTHTNDITLFLHHEMAKIRDRHSLAEDWPGHAKVQEIARKADGLFIYAATACRFLDAPRLTRSRLEMRLDMILDDRASGSSPQKTLDSIYTRILQFSVIGDAIDEEREEIYRLFKLIVGSVIMLREPLSARALSDLLLVPKWRVDEILEALSSVLTVPEDDNAAIQLLHLSFRDFLIDRQRCHDDGFWISQTTAHRTILQNCLVVMSTMLCQNICGLPNTTLLSSEIGPSQVNKHIPAHLQYACRNWVYHLRQSDIMSSNNGDVHEFLKSHFLHWLEVLSLSGNMPEGVQMVVDLSDHLFLLPREHRTQLQDMVHDAKRFVLRFRSLVESAPLQIYSSALIFAPERSIIRKLFEDYIPKWVERPPIVEKEWEALLLTLEASESYDGDGVAFSPDGKLVASSAVRIWDAATGTLLKHLDVSDEGGDVAFSPDGKYVISTSQTGSVRIWDVATGLLVQESVGQDTRPITVFSHDRKTVAMSAKSTVTLVDVHQGLRMEAFQAHSEVATMKFSPDDRLLASLSRDSTVRVWDTSTRTLVLTIKLEFHGHHADVAFAPDGEVLAATEDCSIPLVDPLTGEKWRTIHCPSNPRYVTFSSDGRILCSVCERSATAFLWDVKTGGCVTKIEASFTIPVFSPDGRLITSKPLSPYSVDDPNWRGTIEIWDTTTGALVKSFDGHSSHCRSLLKVSFSSDGKRMVSASGDGTIRIWDVNFGPTPQKIDSHNGSVRLMALSPSGKLAASAAYDDSVGLWDVETGAHVRMLDIGSFVASIKFSPDGRLLIVPSNNGKIGVWDTASGVQLHSLEGPLYAREYIALTLDSKLLASTRDRKDWNDDEVYEYNDCNIGIWDINTGTLLHDSPSRSLNSLNFSPDGRLLATGCDNGTVQLWDTARGTLLQTLEGHAKAVGSVTFSPDGTLIASASRDRTVRLWDTFTGNLLRTLGHSHSVFNIVFAPNGKLLASISNPYEQTVRLCDPATGAMLGEREFKYGSLISFTSDSSTLNTSRGQRNIRTIFPDVAAKTEPGMSCRELYVTPEWVFQGEEKLLLLPHDYRATCAITQNELLVIGDSNGRISIMSLK